MAEISSSFSKGLSFNWKPDFVFMTRPKRLGGEWDLDADMKVKALRGRFDADDYAAHVSGDQ